MGAEVIEEYDEDKDEVVASSTEIFKAGQILDVEQIGSEDGRTQFQFGDGSVMWLDDEDFEEVVE